MNKKNKLITLSGGKKFLIIEQCKYNNEDYYFACEVINENMTDNYKIFTIVVVKNIEKVKEIKDDNIVKNVCQILEKEIL